MLRGLFLSASTDNTMTFFTKIPVHQATSVPVPTAAAVALSEPAVVAPSLVSTSVNQTVVSEPAVSTIPTPEGWQSSPIVSASVNQAVASNTEIENNAPSTTSSTTTNPLFAELQNSLAERRPMIASLPPKDWQPLPAVSTSINQAVASNTGMKNNAPRTTSSPTNLLSAEQKSRLAERRQKTEDRFLS